MHRCLSSFSAHASKMRFILGPCDAFPSCHYIHTLFFGCKGPRDVVATLSVNVQAPRMFAERIKVYSCHHDLEQILDFDTKLALSLQRCRKTQKMHPHAGREALFCVTLAERGRTIFEIDNTSAVTVPPAKQPFDCRGVAKMQNRVPTLGGSFFFQRSGAPWERDFRLLQHPCSKNNVSQS